jgi:hypothetical protein
LRHCFIGDASPEGGWGIHFFEYHDSRLFTDGVRENFATITADHAKALLDDEPSGAPAVKFIDGALQHVAFALPDEESVVELRANLEARGIPMSQIVDTGMPLKFFLFPDNNGVILEVVWGRTRESR